MNPIRYTEHFPPGSLHILDAEGDNLERWLQFHDYKVADEQLHHLRSEICPNWLWHIVDASSDAADEFYFEKYDTRCRLKTNLTGLQLGQFPEPEYAINLKDVYRAVKMDHINRTSMETILSGEPRSFVRSVMPLKGFGNYRKLLIATRYQEVVRIPEIPEELRPTTGQKIKGALNTIERSLERAVTGRFVLQVNGFKSVSMAWNAGINDFLEGLTDNPLNTLLPSNGLGVNG